MIGVWSKIIMIVACTMAGSSIDSLPTQGTHAHPWDGLPGWVGRVIFAHNSTQPHHTAKQGNTSNPNSTHNRSLDSIDMTEVCTAPCSILSARVSAQHLMTPFIVACTVWLLVALPTLALKGRKKVLGVRSCLWVLSLLWIQILIGYTLFGRERVWGYAWAVHSSTQALATWTPSRRSLAFQCAHPWLMILGVLYTASLAWQTGPPVGLISWSSGKQSQCGWAAHLIAVLGVDFVQWALSPIKLMVGGEVSSL